MRQIGFVMEQTLGHVTHHQNLARRVAEEDDIHPIWMPVAPERDDRWARLPVIRGNWSLQGSLRAREALRTVLRSRPPDALLIHTQTVALFALPMMRRIPTLLSLDATPLNFDRVGAAYHHPDGKNGLLERAKHAWTRKVFHAAAHLVAWSRWAQDSLIADYGVPAERISIVPPGVDSEVWTPCEIASPLEADAGPVRLLFVGGDFVRKGGDTLLEAYRTELRRNCTLDLVTGASALSSEAGEMAGVTVHTNLTPNSPALRHLYAQADLFVLPTRGDCLPLALLEAMAMGLPIVSTPVGAIPEAVVGGRNGLLVPPGDAAALIQAVRTLVDAPAQRAEYAHTNRREAVSRFDARRNYGTILAHLKKLADVG